MRRLHSAVWLFALTVLFLAACKKKREPIEIEAGPPLPESTADIDAKETVKTIVAVYPLACDSSTSSRAWNACREASGGYGKVYSCAEKGLRDARAALTNLRPSNDLKSACAQEVEKGAIAMLNATPKFFQDVIKWLQEKHDPLLTALSTMPLGEACRSSKDLCTGEPHDYDDAYKAMRMHDLDTMECTNRMFKCGQKDLNDCWLANVAPRLGVACAGTANRTGASPDDLLYVKETGTPIAR
jgi:hypothetical protein